MKAKLSTHYRSVLTPDQQSDARSIIRSLSARAGEKIVTSAYSTSLKLSVDRGVIHHPDMQPSRTRCLSKGASVGDTVCEAVKCGVLPYGTDRPEPAPEPEPERKPEPDRESAAAKLLRRMREIREYLSRDDSQSDILSTRVIATARRMLDAGIPADGILHAYALTWSKSARQTANIPGYDPVGYGKQVDGKHRLYAYVSALAGARVPCLMIGPAGAGKGRLAADVADGLGLTFASIPLTGGASVAWLLGRHTPNGFVETPFIRAYRDGGVFLFDEIDAADPNMLLVVNEALANGTLENPLTGEAIPRHPDFVPLAAANTYGTGADANYTARERLDGATIDRWRLGRVDVAYDTAVEESIMLKGGE